MKLSKPKYIFVTGGVASSLGKGVISASVARLLQARGYSVTQTEDFKVVTSTQQVRWGEELVTTVADGKIVSVVQSVEEA